MFCLKIPKWCFSGVAVVAAAFIFVWFLVSGNVFFTMFILIYAIWTLIAFEWRSTYFIFNDFFPIVYSKCLDTGAMGPGSLLNWKFIGTNGNSFNIISKLTKKYKETEMWTYPYCVSASGTSILWDARRRSLAISANLAKSVSVSAKRAERLDSNKRTSSKRFFKSIGGCKWKLKRKKKRLLWDGFAEWEKINLFMNRTEKIIE